MQEEEEQEDHQQVLEQEQEQLEDNILGTPTAGKNCGGAASFPLPHLWLIILRISLPHYFTLYETRKKWFIGGLHLVEG